MAILSQYVKKSPLEPVARVLIPQPVPYGFHGAWIGEAQLNASRGN